MLQIRPAVDTDTPAIADLIASLAPFAASITPPALAAVIVRVDVIYLVGDVEW